MKGCIIPLAFFDVGSWLCRRVCYTAGLHLGSRSLFEQHGINNVSNPHAPQHHNTGITQLTLLEATPAPHSHLASTCSLSLIMLVHEYYRDETLHYPSIKDQSSPPIRNRHEDHPGCFLYRHFVLLCS